VNTGSSNSIMNSFVPGEVIIFPVDAERWVAANLRAKTFLGLDIFGLGVISELRAGNNKGNSNDSHSFSVWDIFWFSNRDGLLADPTRMRRDVADWPAPKQLNRTELIETFRGNFLYIENGDEYESLFTEKKSLLDQKRFGNFHQQLGQELMLNQRVSPSDWWLGQKFHSDFQSLRNNLYGAVEGPYLKKYFEKRFSAGINVVDIGCGPGYFSNLIAKTGATVLGVDPSEPYIDIAQNNRVENATFVVASVGEEGGLNVVPDNSADAVFISDALLFYFVPPDPTIKADINILFNDIRRILKPGGTLISVEPHYLFWLMPWLGDEEHPFTALTEYRNRTFHVTPPFSELIQAYANGGFAVTWMEEMYPSEDFKASNSRAFHFANEFPIGQLFELKQLAAY